MLKKGFTPLEKSPDKVSGTIPNISDRSSIRLSTQTVRKRNSLTGFTLLEVLIVVIIIGILAAISLPQYTATIEKSRSGEASANIGTLRTSIDRYWYQNGSFPGSFDVLDIDNPNNVTNKLYTYTMTDTGTTATTRSYTVTGTRTAGGNTYTVTWTQTDNNTGKLTRSANLGGPTS